MSMLVRYQAYEPLVLFTPDWSGVEPNVALSYEAGEYVGDPGAIDEVTVGLGNHIDAILGQVRG